MTETTSSAKEWTSKDDEFLRRNAGLLTTPELAETLKRSKTAVSLRAHILKISLRCINSGWDDETHSQLIKLKESGATWSEIAEKFNRSSEACRKAYVRALKKRDYTQCFKPSMSNTEFATYTYQLFNIVKNSPLATEHTELLSEIEMYLTDQVDCAQTVDETQSVEVKSIE
jgi:Myb-like DNA-binding domain